MEIVERPHRSRYCFVVPRFGSGIIGGCEMLVGSVAKHLLERGDYVEILSTCAKDNRTWENFFPSGSMVEDGIRITRFPVDERNLEVWIPLQIAIGEGLKLSVEDQLRWMEEGVNSSALYNHIAMHSEEFDAIFFAPYLFPTTFWGAQIDPERSWLIPCLHDEAVAYLEITQVLFRTVKGSLFNSGCERALAQNLYGPLRGESVGMGFDLLNGESIQPYFKDTAPYILYLGRKETGKNVQRLIDLFIAAKDSEMLPDNLKLVIAGGGSFSDLHRDSVLSRDDVIDCQSLSEIEKQQAIKYALCLAQPSTNESFSIVLMESWLQGTPVLVSAAGSVTRDHVVRSGGGLYFADMGDFAGAVSLLLKDANLRAVLGTAGKRYVKEQYNWQSVLNRFDSALLAE